LVGQQGNWSFPGRVNLKERSVSYSKMNTLLFCVFTFRVDLWNVFFVANEKYLWLEEDEQLGFIQDKHYDLSVASKRCQMCFFLFSSKMTSTDKKRTLYLLWDVLNGLVLLISTMICFAFFLMARMTGAGWCYRSGTLSTLFGNAP